MLLYVVFRKGVTYMKKIIGVLVVTVMISVCLIDNVLAQNVYYTNSNGVQMTELEYNKMLQLFSEEKVNYLSQEEFDKYKDMTILSTDSVYQKTISLDGEVISEEIISKEEYDSSSDENLPIPYVGDSQYYETTYKKLTATVGDSTGLLLISSIHWKKIPYIKSYDVYAFRVTNMSHSNLAGTQTYYHDGTADSIFYDTTAPGYKYATNGAGYSMNLVDNATGYDLAISSELAYNTTQYTTAHIYVSYQHAQRDVSRETSKSYTFSPSGYGNVVLFNNSTIAGYYDAMPGVHLQIPIQ